MGTRKKLVARRVVTENEEVWLETMVEYLWGTPLFARCKRPIIEACGDFTVFTFQINNMKSINTSLRVMELLSYGCDLLWIPGYDLIDNDQLEEYYEENYG